MESWISVRPASSIVADFRFASCLVHTPRQLQVLFERFQTHASRVFENLSSCAWEVAVGLFIRSPSWIRLFEEGLEFSLVNDWKRVFQSILRNGDVDIHGMVVDARGGIQVEHSAMLHLLHQPGNPENLVRHLEVWLEILQACNVQVQQYLDRELVYCRQNFDPNRIDSDFEIELCQETILGFTSPCWRNKDLMTSPARELLQEYPHLRRRTEFVHIRITDIGAVLEGDENDQPRLWKLAALGYHDCWRVQWPFFSPTFLQMFDQFTPRGIQVLGLSRLLARTEELQGQRLERRRVRKLWKNGVLSRRRRGAAMPGSWMEDWE